MSVVQMNNSSNEQLVQTGSSTVQKGGGEIFPSCPPIQKCLVARLDLKFNSSSIDV